MYARVFPGLGTPTEDVPGVVHFVIGPEKQLDAYERYLEKAEEPGTRLLRLCPRDFWIE